DAAFLSHIEERFAGRVRLHFSCEEDGCRIDPMRDIPPLEEGHHLYVCGPAGFIDAVLGGARALGWPDDNLHREFFSAPNLGGSDADGAFQLKIASTGEILDVPADRTVAQVLSDAGIELPLSCEQGVCGTC